MSAAALSQYRSAEPLASGHENAHLPTLFPCPLTRAIDNDYDEGAADALVVLSQYPLCAVADIIERHPTHCEFARADFRSSCNASCLGPYVPTSFLFFPCRGCTGYSLYDFQCLDALTVNWIFFKKKKTFSWCRHSGGMAGCSIEERANISGVIATFLQRVFEKEELLGKAGEELLAVWPAVTNQMQKNDMLRTYRETWDVRWPPGCAHSYRTSSRDPS